MIETITQLLYQLNYRQLEIVLDLIRAIQRR